MKYGFGVLIATLLLAGCGKTSTAPEVAQSLDVKDYAAAADATETTSDRSAPVPTAEPRIAYKYRHGYRLEAGKVGSVQQAHLALCDKLGTSHCRVVSMDRASSEGDFIRASLNLQVDAKQARAFGAALDKVVGDAGGDVSDQGIEAEDLSKQMVDTEARIKAKQALADRLLVLLRNRSGKVGELVEAERAFADAQEELDAARSWMAEMQQRVSFSAIEISYNSSAPSGSGLWQPIRASFASAGRTIGSSVGSLVSFVAIVLPWLIAGAGLVWLLRRLGWRTRWKFPWPTRWRKAEPDA
jgi:hypothetical protein